MAEVFEMMKGKSGEWVSEHIIYIMNWDKKKLSTCRMKNH
jgi:hypothetical protein